MKPAPLLLALLGWLMLAAPARALDGGRYGEVRLQQPTGEVRGLVVLFSDAGGWEAADDATAQALAAAGAIVVGVDTPRYLRRLDQTRDACDDDAFNDAESLSHQLQRQHGAGVYLAPILAGTGIGGTLARVALAQAPANTIAGAVMLRPAAIIPGTRPLCAEPPATAADGGFAYPAAKTPPGFLAEAKEDRATGDGARTALVTAITPHLGATVPNAGNVSSLPLVEVPAAQPSGLMAIVLSGDGGWRDLDKTIAERLGQRGIPVVGWDCLRYFWSRKTPAQTAADLAAVIATYKARFQARHVALIGYSFGADVLPFAFNRLSPQLRESVALITLLGFSKAAEFEIRVAGWLGSAPSAAALPTTPEIDRVPGSLIQCVHGEKETDSACPALAARGAEVIRTRGGHHFGGDYVALATRIEEGLRRRVAP
ncbi:Virulence factor family protein [Rhodovastum atsumiense]|uniref:Virulence factor family protein n=1 Tax=Rhodovastum atsumiense TaxID=504468 RepID=A0A5M6IZS3_9PROT|nr:AcvB/VirJ family lysyl-phosphatidylglycerol hydrolase [Rhodovastum atsumiense]KAA5612848.1 virulence factor family protein [Rhodovastum atsumiense]CAH2601086.1 Virulence factor family protein [Rhodovastum atsumiense]